MSCRHTMLLLLLPLLAGCGRERSATVTVRGPVQPALARQTAPIDWQQSAGIFIGIEEFHGGTDRPGRVDFAADDATDLAWFFARERRPFEQLPADRTVLLLSGRPRKPESQQRLRELERDSTVIRGCIDTATIYAQVDRFAQQVGRDGILVVSIATHGLTTARQQLLLTCDSPLSPPRGVVLGRMLQSLSSRSGRRLLLIIDACRTLGTLLPFSFEDLDLPAGYAVLSATSPLRKAYSRERLGNGTFTYALLEALRCRAPAGADGALSATEIDSWVGSRVAALSGGAQHPEGHFVGSLRDVELVTCATRPAGEIEKPVSGGEVPVSDVVKVHVRQPGLFLTVLVCPTENGVCYNQNPAHLPRSVPAGGTEMNVHYTAGGGSEVWVALTADPAFLRNEYEIGPVPLERHAERTVYWLGPVNVHRNEGG